MQKTQATKKKQRDSEKANLGNKSSSNPGQQIREAGVLTSKSIEKGHSQSEVPQSQRKNFASFGSE